MRRTTLYRAAAAASFFLALPALFALSRPEPVYEKTTSGIIDWSALVVRSDVTVPWDRYAATGFEMKLATSRRSNMSSWMTPLARSALATGLR